MENSKSVIYIQFHNSKEKGDNVGKKLRSDNAVAMTMTLTDYNQLKNGESKDNFDDNFIFNENTGEYDKTSAWDNTVIAFDEKQIAVLGAAEAGYSGFEDLQQGINVVLADYGTHEGDHTTQKYADFNKKTKDPVTGKYIKPEVEGSTKKPYAERRHEKEADAKGKKAAEELRKKKGQVN